MPRRSRDEDDDRFEDDEDERPARSRRRRDEDDEPEERPARSRRSSKDEDEDEEEAPKRTRRRAARDDDDDEEDEKPARSRRRVRDEDDDDEPAKPARSRRRSRDDDEDDEDEKPKARRRSRDDDEDDDDEPARAAIKGGWGAARKVRDDSSSYAQTLKLGTDDQVIKFLEDAPYASYREHWIEKEGKKSFTCLQGLDPKGCPLCAAGDKPRSKFSFNVAVWDEGWTVKSLDVGVTVFEQLGNFNADKRNGPLTKNYWAVKRTGKQSKSVTNFTPIKPDDLVDDWDADEISSKELKGLKLYDSSAISVPKRRELQELAKSEFD